jgi:NADPH-dependent curcumin reductase CurA
LSINTYSVYGVAGEWVLVTASAGGVGIAACQLAKGPFPSAVFLSFKSVSDIGAQRSARK